MGDPLTGRAIAVGVDRRNVGQGPHHAAPHHRWVYGLFACRANARKRVDRRSVRQYHWEALVHRTVTMKCGEPTLDVDWKRSFRIGRGRHGNRFSRRAVVI
jgi:hypothetical protein